MKLNFLPQLQMSSMSDYYYGSGYSAIPVNTATSDPAASSSSGNGNGWNILNNILGAATQAANIFTGIKTQSPVVQAITQQGTQQQQPGQTIVYQQPAPEPKTNTGLIIGIIAAVLVLAIVLILVFKKKGG